MLGGGSHIVTQGYAADCHSESAQQSRVTRPIHPEEKGALRRSAALRIKAKIASKGTVPWIFPNTKISDAGLQMPIRALHVLFDLLAHSEPDPDHLGLCTGIDDLALAEVEAFQCSIPIHTATDGNTSTSCDSFASTGSGGGKRGRGPGEPSDRSRQNKRGRQDASDGNGGKDDDDGSDDCRSRSSSRSSLSRTPERKWACPFFKRDPQKFWRCPTKIFRSVADIRQHFKRDHPEAKDKPYCPRCGREFDNDPDSFERDEHVRQKNCKADEFDRIGGLTQLQFDELEADGTRRNIRTLEQRWYDAWDICFPQTPRPDSPYLATDSGFYEIFKSHRFAERLAEPIVSEIMATHPSQCESTLHQTIRTFVERIETYLTQTDEPSGPSVAPAMIRNPLRFSQASTLSSSSLAGITQDQDPSTLYGTSSPPDADFTLQLGSGTNSMLQFTVDSDQKASKPPGPAASYQPSHISNGYYNHGFGHHDESTDPRTKMPHAYEMPAMSAKEVSKFQREVSSMQRAKLVDATNGKSPSPDRRTYHVDSCTRPFELSFERAKCHEAPCSSVGTQAGLQDIGQAQSPSQISHGRLLGTVESPIDLGIPGNELPQIFDFDDLLAWSDHPDWPIMAEPPP